LSSAVRNNVDTKQTLSPKCGNKKLVPPVYISEVTIVNKRMFVFVISLAILLCAGLIVKPHAVFACSCAAPLSAEK
jgi:Na+/pantothenate symporter